MAVARNTRARTPRLTALAVLVAGRYSAARGAALAQAPAAAPRQIAAGEVREGDRIPPLASLLGLVEMPEVTAKNSSSLLRRHIPTPSVPVAPEAAAA